MCENRANVIRKINRQIDETRELLLSELKRIVNLLEHTEIRPQDSYANSYVRSELKGKMAEARRDMVRLEKLLYMKPYEYDERWF